MPLASLAALAARQLPPADGRPLQYMQPLPGLGLLRHQRATSFEAALLNPVLVLALEGRKETRLGDDSFVVSAGECLLVSHDLPVVARVTRAPYLALLLDIELATLRELYDVMGDGAPEARQARALGVQRCGPELAGALERYLALSGAPTDAAVLGPLVSREIHYRLARAPSGGMLRALSQRDSHASAIARAITRLRRDFRAHLEVPALARSVGMSPSAFHKHFKAITASSPLQYRKSLQLFEARRLLRAGQLSVTEVAFEVGYESPAQFSRDYARKFGAPPRTDRPAP